MRLTAPVLAALLAGAGMLAAPVPAAAEPAARHVGAGTLRAEPAHGETSLRERARKLGQRRARIRSKLSGTVLREREVVIVERTPVEQKPIERPVAQPAPAADGPPDPASPFTGLRARGAGPAPVPEIGTALPDGIAYVTLDWRIYGLERPPAGQIYARIRHSVLRIDPESRRVIERIATAAR